MTFREQAIHYLFKSKLNTHPTECCEGLTSDEMYQELIDELYFYTDELEREISEIIRDLKLFGEIL